MNIKTEIRAMLSNALTEICESTKKRIVADGWLPEEGQTFRRSDLHMSTWQFRADLQEVVKRNKFHGYEIVVETIVVAWTNQKGVFHEHTRIPIPILDPSEWETISSTLEESVYGEVLSQFLKGL